jgi:hypothetical protein
MSTAGFDLAAIAGVSWRAVPDDFPLMINFGPYQGDANGTFPGVPVAMEAESACMVLISSSM